MRKGLSEETLLKLLVTSYGNGQYATMLPDLLRLALLTGARLSDLCDLKLADVPFFQLTEKFSNHTLDGWRRSADRAGLQRNSLLSGNFTGNFTLSGLQERSIETRSR